MKQFQLRHEASQSRPPVFDRATRKADLLMADAREGNVMRRLQAVVAQTGSQPIIRLWLEISKRHIPNVEIHTHEQRVRCLEDMLESMGSPDMSGVAAPVLDGFRLRLIEALDGFHRHDVIYATPDP